MRKDKIILLDESICGSKVPPPAQGELFKYKVIHYNEDKDEFKLQFMEQAIELNGIKWIDFPSTEEDKTMDKVITQ